jgi:predicted amidohydrolase
MLGEEMNLKIALAQIELKLASPKNNLEVAEIAVNEAARQGADIVLLPELWASGYDLENANQYASSLSEGWFAKMRELAAKHGIALGGSMIEEEGGKLFNTFLFVDWHGELLGKYRKAHLFDLIDEKEYFTAGKSLSVVESTWGKLGLALCYDLRFPELFRAYALKGVETILLVAEWPQRRIAHWDTLLLARAIENQCFIAAVNKVGISKGEILGGHSAVINPMGEILVQGEDAPGVFLAEITPEEVAKARAWMPVLDDRNPAVYD